MPRRLVGVTGTALVVSVALLTGWGLVEWSTDPAVVYESACICAVASSDVVGAAPVTSSSRFWAQGSLSRQRSRLAIVQSRGGYGVV